MQRKELNAKPPEKLKSVAHPSRPQRLWLGFPEASSQASLFSRSSLNFNLCWFLKCCFSLFCSQTGGWRSLEKELDFSTPIEIAAPTLNLKSHVSSLARDLLSMFIAFVVFSEDNFTQAGIDITTFSLAFLLFLHSCFINFCWWLLRSLTSCSCQKTVKTVITFD